MNRFSVVLLMAIFGILASLKPACAGNPATVSVTVSINGSLSVSVSPTSYAFGTLGLSVGSISNSAVVVTNNSNAFRETYSLSATNTADWALGNTAGNNQFILSATFSASQPASGFVDNNHNLSLSGAACTSSVFAGSQTGVSVDVGATRNLWFEVVTPSSITVGNGSTETSTVTIVATAG